MPMWKRAVFKRHVSCCCIRITYPSLFFRKDFSSFEGSPFPLQNIIIRWKILHFLYAWLEINSLKSPLKENLIPHHVTLLRYQNNSPMGPHAFSSIGLSNWEFSARAWCLEAIKCKPSIFEISRDTIFPHHRPSFFLFSFFPPVLECDSAATQPYFTYQMHMPLTIT